MRIFGFTNGGKKMEKEEILEKLREDEKEGNGELLSEDGEEAKYYSYDTCGECNEFMVFRYGRFCTRDKLEQLIYVSDAAAKHDITPALLADILADAYKDMLPDMMCVIRRIVVVHDEKDFPDMLHAIYPKAEEYEIQEMLDYELDDFVGDFVGKTWFMHQTAFIFEGTIHKIALEEGDEIITHGDNYLCGIATTAIHEVRHLMLDCNFILPEDKYPVELSSEENVEEFCRSRWDMLENNYKRSLKLPEDEKYRNIS